MAADFSKWRLVLTDRNNHTWLSRAEKELQERGCAVPVWLEGGSLEDSLDKDCVYVLESFDCDCYSVLHGKYRVLGAHAVVDHLQRGLSLPTHLSCSQSVYSLAMSGINITCTSVPRDQRMRLYQQVKLLGGQALGDLTVKTTHLICGEVQSLKYKIAVKAGLPIMLPSWVGHIWDTATLTDRVFHATDGNMMSHHRCGVFQGLLICVTGLDVERRSQVQALTQQHGGVYSGEMKKDECTHLLVDKPEGQKYAYARRWQLTTVHSAWFFDSVSAGVCLPEDGYVVTPPPPPAEPGLAVVYSQPWAVALNKFEPSVGLSNTLLKGCQVYFSGFLHAHVEKLTALLHLVGAVRLKQLNSAVTHVLVGQQDQEETAKLARVGDSVKLVKVEWLLACCQSGSHVDMDEYAVVLEPPQEGAGHAGKRPNFCERQVEENEDDIMQLYLGGGAGDGEEQAGGVLYGRQVAVSDRLKEEKRTRVMELLQQLGATVSAAASSSAEFVVAPLFMPEGDYRAVEQQGVPVTVCWLERQTEAKAFLPPESHFLFHPTCGQINPSALEGCTVYISQYEGLERDYLQTMSEKMGAKLSADFHHNCTHLILKEASGEKYKAALKWRVHTVWDTWVYMATKHGRRVTESEHAVGGTTLAMEPLKQSSVTADKTNSRELSTENKELITPFRSLQPKLNTRGALQALQSPVSQEEVNTQHLGALFTNALAQAADNFGTGDQLARKDVDGGTVQREGGTDLHAAVASENPLAGVVIFVSQKLIRKQVELHTLVTALGGEYHWTYDSSCTHYIHQCRESEQSKGKELKQARANGCHIVSPQWLRACSEAAEKVPESQFPSYFNFRKSLNGLAVKSPGRSLSQPSQVQTVKHSSTVEATNRDSPLRSRTSPSCKVTGSTSEEERMEGVEPPSTSNDSNTLQMREDFQRDIAEIEKQIHGQPRRRSQRLRTQAAEGLSAQSRKRKPVSANGNKRRKVSASDDESNSLDGGVKWDTSSQTVTYENPMAKSGREQIIALLENVEANNHRAEAMEEGTTDESDTRRDAPSRTDSRSGVQDAVEPGSGHGGKEVELNVDSTPRPPPLGVPIVTTSRGEPTLSCVSDVVFEEQPKASGSRMARPFPLLQLCNTLHVSGEYGLAIPCTRPLTKKFMFSSLSEEARVTYGDLVVRLGGQVLDGSFFNPACTHLVVGKPSRNEKYLSAVAAGKWVLHVSYLESSREAGSFVKEELHEWGGLASGATPSALEATAKKWRVELEGRRKMQGSNVGAFQYWKVILAIDKTRLAGMKRLLEAGGAQVLGIRPPYAKFSEATHAFVDFGKLNKLNIDKSDIENWNQAKVMCLKPEYISEFLMHGTSVSESEHCVSYKDL